MSADPYGFAEAPAASAGAATQALYSGVLALVCAAVGPCFCYAPYLVALPAGAYAVYKGAKVPSGRDELSSAEKSMASAGMVAGGVAAALSLMVMLLIGAYALFVGLAVVAGGLSE